MNIKKIAIIGNLANVGFTMTKYMSELDVICNLIVTESQYSLLKKQNPDVDLSQCSFIRIIKDSGILKKYTVKLDIVKVLNEYDIIISVGLGGFWSLPLVSKPYVAYATGSDLRELAMGGKEYPRINKIVSRYLFKKAKMIFYSPDQGHLDAIKKLQLKNTIPWR
ncbi:MAG: hypothetical protein ACREBJ_07570, partial [Nitrosotalea sp.]